MYLGALSEGNVTYAGMPCGNGGTLQRSKKFKGPGCPSNYDEFGGQMGWVCCVPRKEQVRQAPAHITVSPVIQTQVSPQISPVFQQSYMPKDSPMSAGTTQQTSAPQSAKTAPEPSVDYAALMAAQSKQYETLIEKLAAREPAPVSVAPVAAPVPIPVSAPAVAPSNMPKYETVKLEEKAPVAVMSPETAPSSMMQKYGKFAPYAIAGIGALILLMSASKPKKGTSNVSVRK